MVAKSYKKPSITIDELNQIVIEREQKLAAAKQGKGSNVDTFREEKMKERRAKSADGTLRAIIHPSRNARRIRAKWDTLLP